MFGATSTETKCLYDSCLIVASAFDDFTQQLTIETPFRLVVKSFGKPNSGLEIQDRRWLKIVIPDAFLGKFIRFTEILS